MITLSAMMWKFLSLNVRERSGDRDHPAIQWAHELCRMGEGVADEVPWCSSLINLAAALTDHKRSQSAAARSWLNPDLGELETNVLVMPPLLKQMNVARTDFGQVGEKNGVLIFRRGRGRGMLGAEVKDAPGHVAVFERYDPRELDQVYVIGGNQSNAISVTKYPIEDLIGVLRVKSAK